MPGTLSEIQIFNKFLRSISKFKPGGFTVSAKDSFSVVDDNNASLVYIQENEINREKPGADFLADFVFDKCLDRVMIVGRREY